MRVLRGAWCAVSVWAVAASAQAGAILPFISEIHYDNSGADRGEFVAVTAAVGTDLSGWQLVLYNGATGAPYDTLELTGMVGGDSSWGELDRVAPGLQNAEEAVALVSPARAVVDFVAYEGLFTVVDGVAAGSIPRLLPKAEGSGTPQGYSLQRTGGLEDWLWDLWPATPGRLNEGLNVAPVASVQQVPVPAVILLWLLAPVVWTMARRTDSGPGRTVMRPTLNRGASMA